MRLRSFPSVALVVVLAAGCGSTEEPSSEPTEAAEQESSEPAEHETDHETDHETEHEAEPEPEPAADIGAAFVAFVRGGDVPPMWHEASLYLGNALTGVVTPGLAADLPVWATCTEVGEYAGRSCPISPVRVLKQHRKVAYAEAAESECLQTYAPIPKPLRKLDRVVVVPAKGSVDSCVDDFAVQLFTNDGGQLVAVSTLLGGP